jgi:hypothetical protein
MPLRDSVPLSFTWRFLNHKHFLELTFEKNANSEQHPLSQVYSFVPIPGAQQHKRPRRRYEEIERMYKCGWNGCEKAYGTLNHLNAHVTMQSHGQKRTPEGMSNRTHSVSFPIVGPILVMSCVSFVLSIGICIMAFLV